MNKIEVSLNYKTVPKRLTKIPVMPENGMNKIEVSLNYKTVPKRLTKIPVMPEKIKEDSLQNKNLSKS